MGNLGSPADIISPWTNNWLGSLGCCLVAQRSCLWLRDDQVQVLNQADAAAALVDFIGCFSSPQPMRITFYWESARKTPRDFQSIKPELANMDSYPKVRVIRHCFAPTQCPKQLGCDKSQNKPNLFMEQSLKISRKIAIATKIVPQTLLWIKHWRVRSLSHCSWS